MLADAIKLLLQNHNLFQKHLVFFDAFCGMGSVADSMKPIYDHIVINDSLKCATIFTRGKLYANRCTFERLGFDPFTFFNENSNTIHGFFYQNYSFGGSERMYFSKENAGRIDYFRMQIEEWKENSQISEKEYVYLLACLLESVSDVSNTAGVYGAFLKHWDKRALMSSLYNP